MSGGVTVKRCSRCGFTHHQSGISRGTLLNIAHPFCFPNTFYRPGFRLVPARELVRPEEKDDPDNRRERIPAVSNRQLALTSAPDRAADEMQNRHPGRLAASGCRSFALRFWQGIMGGPLFHVYIEVYEGLAC